MLEPVLRLDPSDRALPNGISCHHDGAVSIMKLKVNAARLNSRGRLRCTLVTLASAAILALEDSINATSFQAQNEYHPKRPACPCRDLKE